MGAEPIRVMHVDDHPLAQAGMRTLLYAFPDLELVGTAGSGEEAITLCAATCPNVVVMDLLMPGLGGVAATEALRRRHPAVQVIALSSAEDRDLVEQALRAGAIGYLLKTASAFELAQAIRAAASGRAVLAPEATEALVRGVREPDADPATLTEREREVLGLLAQGLSNAQIASSLKISVAAVKFHARGIFAKLGVGSRAEAIALAYRRRLVGRG